jgi:hypothetical protein
MHAVQFLWGSNKLGRRLDSTVCRAVFYANTQAYAGQPGLRHRPFHLDVLHNRDAASR